MVLKGVKFQMCQMILKETSHIKAQCSLCAWVLKGVKFQMCQMVLKETNHIKTQCRGPKLKWPYIWNTQLKMFQYFMGIILTVSVLTSMKRTSSET